ncbi:hypothetical protein TNCV_3192831 [Trichonephila clavipes]|nr:hypothetical protein TNCV_3192831 [Trichonephila clavipes]
MATSSFMTHNYSSSQSEVPRDLHKLNKALYGLHQSGCQWYFEIDDVLSNLGFQKILRCNCVYVYQCRLILLLYVDDIVMFGETKKDLDNAFGFLEVRLDDGVTFSAGWCVNRVWVPWMSTSSPRYRFGGGENVICQSAHLGDSGTGSTSF